MVAWDLLLSSVALQGPKLRCLHPASFRWKGRSESTCAEAQAACGFEQLFAG